MKSNKVFEKPTLEVLTFSAADVMTISSCPFKVNIGDGSGDSSTDYGSPEY